MDEIADRLMGVYGKCPKSIQTMGINLVDTREWLINNSGPVSRNLELLQRAQGWSDEQFSEYQDSRLRQILRFAYDEIPFYKRLYKGQNVDISGIRTAKDLAKLPTISKRDVVSNWKDFVPQRRIRSKLSYTSGTTGTPLMVRVSRDCWEVNRASSLLRNDWAGHRGEAIARFVGDRPVTDCSDKRLFRRSYVMNRLFFPSYCLSPQTFPRIFDALVGQKVQFLQCYPSTAFILAKFLQERDKYLPLKALLFSSEPMFEFQRDLIEERFRARAFGFYGQAEQILSASQCEKGNYHLAMIDGILEVLRGDEAVSPGEEGLTVATTLCNFAMPLIRYRLDDFTGFEGRKCGCGRNSPTIYPIEAKSDDIIITPEGAMISPSTLTFPFKHLEHILESQIVQKAPDRLVIRIVPEDGFSSDDESKLIDSFRAYVGKNMTIEVERVSEIHQSGSFKKRFVVSELGGSAYDWVRTDHKSI